MAKLNVVVPPLDWEREQAGPEDDARTGELLRELLGVVRKGDNGSAVLAALAWAAALVCASAGRAVGNSARACHESNRFEQAHRAAHGVLDHSGSIDARIIH